MPRTSAITNLPLPGWGGLGLGASAARRAARRRLPGRPGAPTEIAAGALLIVVWAMLWAFFISGVVEPAAGLRARAAAHPSLDVAAALPDARPGPGPQVVDTTGRAP